MPIFYPFLVQIICSFGAIILTLYYFSIKTYNHWKELGIKYVKPVPFFGNTMLTTFRKKSPALNQQEIYNLYPDEKLIGMFMFRTPLLLIRDSRLVHLILTKDFSHFYDRGMTVDERVDLLSSHLVNLKGQKWKSLRSKLTPAFSSGKLKLMSFQLGECANTLDEYLDDLVSSGNSQEFREIMAKFATDVIGSCAFGLQFNTLKDPNSEFRKMGQEIFKPSLRFIAKFVARTFHQNLPYILNLKFLSKEVEKFFLDFVKNTVKEREEQKMERKDFIQLLIERRKEDLTSGSAEDSCEYNCSFKVSLVFKVNLLSFTKSGFRSVMIQ